MSEDEDTASPLPRPMTVTIPLAIAVAAGGLIILAALGELGNRVVSALGVEAGLVAVIFTLVRAERFRAGWQDLPAWTRRTIWGVGILVGFVAPAATVLVLGGSPGFTRTVTVEGGGELQPDRPGSMTIAAITPPQKEIRVQVQLVDFINSSDCLRDATLDLSVSAADGSQGGDSFSVRLGGVQAGRNGETIRVAEPVDLPIGYPASDVHVLVTLHAVAGCTLRFDVNRVG